MTKGYISDGYTEPGYIEEAPRLHPALRFRFRPLLITERSVLFSDADKVPAEEQDGFAAEAMESRVKQWDLTDDAGETVPITRNHILKIKPTLFEKLWAIVTGVRAPDLDPEWKDEDKEAARKLRRDAAIKGTDPGSIREEQDLKNSLTE